MTKPKLTELIFQVILGLEEHFDFITVEQIRLFCLIVEKQDIFISCKDHVPFAGRRLTRGLQAHRWRPRKPQ
jgi:hypothetical protein